MQAGRLTNSLRRDDTPLAYHRDGAERFHQILSQDAVNEVLAATHNLATDRPGIRLYGTGAVLRDALSHSGLVGCLAADILGPTSRPVRAILFDKNPATNWALGWHQDRTIAVTERIEVAGYVPWTIKDGALHVAPPFEVLKKMVTVRIHLDDVPDTNAPLLVAPGSHRFGCVPEGEIAHIVQRCGSLACIAKAGDAWVYATPILHASKVADQPSRRRVLQVDYAAHDLPGGLRWLGI